MAIVGLKLVKLALVDPKLKNLLKVQKAFQLTV